MCKSALLLFVVLLNKAFICSAQVRQSDSIPVYPDMFYEYKIAALDKKTPLDLEYNPLVRKYIEKYTIERRVDVSKIMGLSKLYFPIFEEYLDKYNLPLELKYLSVVESGLDPLAKSPSGAVGLWQFLLNTSHMFDLEVTSYIDERSDIYKSTDAACKYFQYLYHTFHDWNLVLAAYNGGPGVVRNAIERSGGKTNLWEILPYLPEQTQNYVPAFIAMNYILNYTSAHKIYITEPAYNYHQIDTVKVSYEMAFTQIIANIPINMEQLQFLNPQYKLKIIPETGNKQLLILPSSLIKKYLNYENRILVSNNKNTLNQPSTHNKKKIYIVCKGDFLHKIAMKNNCSLEEIKLWNKLSSDSISPGQKLIIYILD